MKKPIKTTKTEATNEALIAKISENQYQPRTFLMMKSLKTLQAPLKNMELFNP